MLYGLLGRWCAVGHSYIRYWCSLVLSERLELTHQVEVVTSLLGGYGYFCPLYATILIWAVYKVNFSHPLTLSLDKLTLSGLNIKFLSFVVC